MKAKQSARHTAAAIAIAIALLLSSVGMAYADHGYGGVEHLLDSSTVDLEPTLA